MLNTLSGNNTGLDSFVDTWLEPIRAGDPPTVERGRRFLLKLSTQWLNVDADHPDLFTCDGAGDGGIDAAFLRRGEDKEEGDTWYLFQGKLGGVSPQAIVAEGTKLVNTLSGGRRRASHRSTNLLGRIA
ncbi:MAG: abortive phage resistance protein, partial [Gemmatimonadota bacterium]|nr:abortive phage resistance protein [Gemmatimonadota bacterium]